MVIFHEMSTEQRRIFIDTGQLYHTYQAALVTSESYKGGMHWKKAKGREYLFKTTDRFGNGKSLGLRSPKTEKIKKEFQTKNKEAKDRVSNLKNKLEDQAKYVKAARIQRVPVTLSRILRVLERQKLLGKNIQIIGTNSLYAYESMAGVFLDREVTATQDADILWDIRPKLTMVTADKMGGFLDVLRKADRTFEPTIPKGYRAANKDGYLVDLIKAEPRPPSKLEKKQMGSEDDLSAAEINNLQWLLSSKRITQTVIGEDGLPAQLVVPDPRAFAIHKLWLSKRIDREPIKKKRDRDQAITVFRLVNQYLPQYPFDSNDLKMFPKKVIEENLEFLKRTAD